MRFGKIGARQMIWDVNNLLPKGGRWVEYLENTGTQWINTRLDNIYSTDIVNGTIAIANDAAVTEDFSFFGVYHEMLPYYYRGGCRAVYGKNFFLYFVQSYYFPKITSSLQEFSITNGAIRFANDTRTNSSSYDGPWTPSFVLFGCNNRGTVVPCAYPGVRFGSYSVERNGVKLIDLKPIAIGNTGYMLDLLTGEYEQYGNKGEGEFVIGPTIAYPKRERE